MMAAFFVAFSASRGMSSSHWLICKHHPFLVSQCLCSADQCTYTTAYRTSSKSCTHWWPACIPSPNNCILQVTIKWRHRQQQPCYCEGNEGMVTSCFLYKDADNKNWEVKINSICMRLFHRKLTEIQKSWVWHWKKLRKANVYMVHSHHTIYKTSFSLSFILYHKVLVSLCHWPSL